MQCQIYFICEIKLLSTMYFTVILCRKMSFMFSRAVKSRVHSLYIKVLIYVNFMELLLERMIHQLTSEGF